MIPFNLEKQSLGIFNFLSFRKCRGLALAWSYDLPVVKQGVIIDTPLTEEDEITLQEAFGLYPLLCRPDAPIGKWTHLPKGRDCTVTQINAFYKECLRENPNSILLCFKSPSVYFTKKRIPRYSVSGGVNILIEWYKCIVIDYVGPGFDVGELTRGCNCSHQSFFVPWNYIHYPPNQIFTDSINNHISQDAYINARDHRINTLASTFGYDITSVKQCIPQESVKMPRSIFLTIWKECISKIVKKVHYLHSMNDLVILVNLYEEKLHVIEVWDSKT